MFRRMIKLFAVKKLALSATIKKQTETIYIFSIRRIHIFFKVTSCEMRVPSRSANDFHNELCFSLFIIREM